MVEQSLWQLGDPQALSCVDQTVMAAPHSQRDQSQRPHHQSWLPTTSPSTAVSNVFPGLKATCQLLAGHSGSALECFLNIDK